MEELFKKFNNNMSNNDFIDTIMELDSIDNGSLCEDDEDYLSDFYDILYNTCKYQIDSNLNNNTLLVNRGESIGEFMKFLRSIG